MLKTFFTQTLPAGIKKAPKKTWEYIKLAKLELIVLVAVLALDLLIKGIVQVTMDYRQYIEIIPNFFYIQYVLNPAAGFGFDFGIRNPNHRRVVFLIFTAIAVTAFFVAMYKFRGKHKLSRITFGLIIAGALGNMFDRMFIRIPEPSRYAGYFGVRDMFRFDFFGQTIGGWSSFPIFNIADVALVVGVIIFAIYFIFMFKPEPPPLIGPVWQDKTLIHNDGLESKGDGNAE